MTNVKIYSNHHIGTDKKSFGRIKSIYKGHEVPPNGRDTKCVFYRFDDGSNLSLQTKFELVGPVYLSRSPSDHYVNPALIKQIEELSIDKLNA